MQNTVPTKLIDVALRKGLTKEEFSGVHAQLSPTSAMNPDLKIGALLLHGLTGMPSEMRPVARRLNQLGIETEAPLLAGHGGSYKEMLDTKWRDWIDSAQEAFDDLAGRCDHVIIVGLSMGSLLAMSIAAKDRRVAGIVMMSPTVRYDGFSVSHRYHQLLPLIDVFPFLGRMCHWTEEPPYGLKDERLQRMITRRIMSVKNGDSNEFGAFRTYSVSLRQLQFLVKDTKKRADSITCPAFIMHSLEDSLTSPANALEVYSWLRMKNKKLVLMTGCDHVMTLDLRKQDVATNVAKFAIKVSWDGIAPGETMEFGVEPDVVSEAPARPAADPYPTAGNRVVQPATL
jgi:carboxylesterase